MTANILVIDIERQGALMDDVWEGKQYNNWVGPGRVIEPSRTICFAYRWIGERKTHFVAEWDWDLPQDNTSPAPGGGHRLMIEAARDLLDEADYVVGWNSKNFDVKHLNAGFFNYGITRPMPHVDIDLMLQNKRAMLLPAKSLSYVTKLKGHAGKIKTDPKLRRRLRFSAGDDLAKAKREMERYNKRDVNETLAVYYDMRPWITGMNLGLYNEDGELQCPNCESTHLHRKGIQAGQSYAYQRYQCQNCGKPVKDTRMLTKTEVVGI